MGQEGDIRIENADPASMEIVIETRVGTTAPRQEIVDLLKLTHQRSPMTATVAKAAKIERKLFVNGIQVPILDREF